MNKEWLNEPNNVKFNYKGYECEIKRHPYFLTLCGYVYINKDNKIYSHPDLDKILTVHGGITFESKELDKMIIGFDCAHAYDYIPGNIIHTISDNFVMNFTYKNIKYVTNELHCLVDQIIELNMDCNFCICDILPDEWEI